jgi:hypothetical protein
MAMFINDRLEQHLGIIEGGGAIERGIFGMYAAP